MNTARTLFTEFSDDSLSRLWLTANVMEAVKEAERGLDGKLEALASENSDLRKQLASITVSSNSKTESNGSSTRKGGAVLMPDGFRRGAWTMEEHERFLEGLWACGRGRWTDVSSKFVLTRSPTQVASHAQKYFQRMKKISVNATPCHDATGGRVPS